MFKQKITRCWAFWAFDLIGIQNLLDKYLKISFLNQFILKITKYDINSKSYHDINQKQQKKLNFELNSSF